MNGITRRSLIAGAGSGFLTLLGGCTEKATGPVELNVTHVSGESTESSWKMIITIEYIAEHIVEDNAGILDVHLEFYDEKKEHLGSKSLGQYRPSKLPKSSWEKKDNGGILGGWGDGDDHFVDYTEEVIVTISKLPKWISFSYDKSDRMRDVNIVTVAQYMGATKGDTETKTDNWELIEVYPDGYQDTSKPKTPILPE